MCKKKKGGGGGGAKMGVVKKQQTPPTITDANKLDDILMVERVHGSDLPLQVIHDGIQLFPIHIRHLDCHLWDTPYMA